MRVIWSMIPAFPHLAHLSLAPLHAPFTNLLPPSVPLPSHTLHTYTTHTSAAERVDDTRGLQASQVTQQLVTVVAGAPILLDLGRLGGARDDRLVQLKVT